MIPPLVTGASCTQVERLVANPALPSDAWMAGYIIHLHSFSERDEHAKNAGYFSFAEIVVLSEGDESFLLGWFP